MRIDRGCTCALALSLLSISYVTTEHRPDHKIDTGVLLLTELEVLFGFYHISLNACFLSKGPIQVGTRYSQNSHLIDALQSVIVSWTFICVSLDSFQMHWSSGL